MLSSLACLVIVLGPLAFLAAVLCPINCLAAALSPLAAGLCNLIVNKWLFSARVIVLSSKVGTVYHIALRLFITQEPFLYFQKLEFVAVLTVCRTYFYY